MRTLWTYGCSWTYSNIHEKEYYLKFWPDIVGDHLDVDEVVNRGSSGESIGVATIKLMKDLPKIKRGDIVIFQFSFPERQCYYDFDKDGYWNWIEPDPNNIESYPNKIGKSIKFIDFVLAFRSELIVREFTNVEPIFDYLENHIGATVKYWFLNVTPPHSPTGKELTPDVIEKIIWNENRSVLFPPKEKRRKNFTSVFSRHMEADAMINYDQLRFCDNGSELRIFSPMSNDTHPDQRGQNAIAKCIIDSFNNNPSNLITSRLI